MTAVDELAAIVGNELAARWLLGRLTDEDKAALSQVQDNVVADTLARCTGWRTDHDRMLLMGNDILTVASIRKMFVLGRISRATADELSVAAETIRRAAAEDPTVHTISLAPEVDIGHGTRN